MRTICRITWSIVIAVTVAMPAMSQLNLPTKRLGNDDYYYYKVKGGESVYGVAEKIGVTVNDIVKYNPQAQNGLEKNQMIFLPVSEFGAKGNTVASKPTTVAATPQAVTHKVKNGESVYGIARTYNVSVDDLITANPSINTGISPGQVLTIPASPMASTGNDVIYHTIVRGESLYSVAKKYNTTIESLVKLNPGVSATNFKADDVIKVQPNTTANITVDRKISQFTPYTAKDGDTYEIIAATHNTTVEALRAANPEVSKIKKGTVVYIPNTAIDHKTMSSTEATEQELEDTYGKRLNEVYDQVHNMNKDDEINVGIILPFQLHKAEPPRQALLYTEFYKGFMLAMDSVGNECGKKININVWDTQHNLNVTDSILALDALKNLDVLIAPSEPKQLERCNKFGTAAGVPVLNCFSTNNDDYVDNAMVMQVYIPSSYLSARVASWIDNRFQNYTIVYLEDPDAEKKEIYQDLKRHFTATKQPTKTLTIINELTSSKLTQYMDPGVNYLFLPSNGSKTLLKKVAQAIDEVKASRFDCEVALLGYPEYTMYTKEYQQRFSSIDTYIFSRFYESSEARDLERKYKARYGEGFMPSAPVMGTYGFDVGMFIVNALSNDHHLWDAEAYHKGLQTTFKFNRVSNWSGAINESLQFIRFSKSGVNIIAR